MVSPTDYTVGVPAEDIAQYRPGGYHPVRIGDFLKEGKYEIKNKLGFGSFSTVWLARDQQEQRNVTLKIVVADKSGDLSRELRILKHLKDSSDTSHVGYKHVLHLLDDFYHDGPNGRHLCLVFNILGPKVSTVAESCTDYRLDGALGRVISSQILLAVNYLHSSGIAHGDIHTGNILFRIPELDSLSPESFGEPILGNVVRRDGKPSDQGVPDYLVEPLELNQSTRGSSEVQLIDFGESFFISNPPETINTPISFHPPELVFLLGMTSAVDIWNLGCTTYELITGRALFEAAFSDHELIPQFKMVIGNMPDEWIPNALRNKLLNEPPDDADAEGFLPVGDDLHRAYFASHVQNVPLSKEDISTLAECLRKMLILDPRNRARTDELLGESWFTRSN